MIVFCDVLLQVFERGLLRAQLLSDSHGREIEIENHQPFIVKLYLARLFGGDGGLGSFGQLELIGQRQLRGRLRVVAQLLKFEYGDFLRLAIFEYREIGLPSVPRWACRICLSP